MISEGDKSSTPTVVPSLEVNGPEVEHPTAPTRAPYNLKDKVPAWASDSYSPYVLVAGCCLRNKKMQDTATRTTGNIINCCIP